MSSVASKIRADRCCNPFALENHKGTGLRKITKKMLVMYPQHNRNAKICNSCRKHKSVNLNESTLSAEMDSSFVDSEDEGQDEDEHPSSDEKLPFCREQELEEMLDGLKKRFSSLPATDPLRIMILTIAPNCWGVKKTAAEFKTSTRTVRKARKLKELSGILSWPTAKCGKTLPDETVNAVKSFYEDDENSRMLPNQRDVITVKINGENVKRQKRLMLSDVKNVYKQFKEKFSHYSIGFSKFAELRPKWCVLAGAKGTHTVCVCTIHQNFKNMFEALNLTKLSMQTDTPLKSYADCFRFSLCSASKPSCYLRKCANCQNESKFSDFLLNLLEDNGISQVVFSVWQTTDRCTLKKECLSAQNFVEEFSSKLEILLPHHFLSKNQSSYIRNMRENLQKHEVLVHTDFSENFAFVVQNAAQAFHYNNNQCTVHPVLFYYKSDTEILHKSFILLSDCTSHDVTAVYIMQKKIIEKIKETVPGVEKIVYVSDGAKQHYKNRSQMCNLAHHIEDFGLSADWHFFATAHGKGACDGLGAIFKREATRASLQASANNSILTAQSLFQWAKSKFVNITFLFYDEKEYNRLKKSLNQRFLHAPAVPKISTSHAFLTVSNKILNIMEYSGIVQPSSTLQY